MQESEEMVCVLGSSLPISSGAAGWEQRQLLPPVRVLPVTHSLQTPRLYSISHAWGTEMQVR